MCNLQELMTGLSAAMQNMQQVTCTSAIIIHVFLLSCFLICVCKEADKMKHDLETSSKQASPSNICAQVNHFK